MSTNPSQAAFKRRDNPGQLFLDFGPSTVAPTPDSAHSNNIAPSQPPRISTDIHPHMSRLPVIPEKTIGPDELSAPSSLPSLPQELRQLAASIEPQQDSSFLTDSRVLELIEQAIQVFRPGEVKAVRVKFLPFRATLYSFKLDRSRTALIKFHIAFRRATEKAVFQAACLMLCRVRKRRQEIERADYDRFIRSLPPADFKLPGARKSRKMSFDAQGQHRHLDDSFDRVNAAYFQSQMKRPELCWSPVRARRILGSYQERNDRLIVSRVFDTPNVPLFVLDFLMYHELLHKFLGIGRRNDGKRCIHSAEFKRLEQQFDRYDEAQACIKRL